LEKAVRDAPHHADSWAMLSMIYGQEYRLGFNPQPDSLSRSLQAARRAVEIAPSNYLAHWALAIALFFQKDLVAFRAEAERTIELNRMDGSTSAFLGLLIAVSGDWDRGCALAESGTQLNPGRAAWHYAPVIYNAYRQGKYREALDTALKIDLPGYFNVPALRAAAFGQLGDQEAARKALEELLALRPHFGSAARRDFGKWFQPELVEQLIDGLRKAGLEVPEEERSAAFAATPRAPSTPGSGVARSSIHNPPAVSATTVASVPTEGKGRGMAWIVVAAVVVIAAAVAAWIYWKAAGSARIDSLAVLPLETRSNDADADYISDGITESVTDSLAKLARLRVVPKSVASHYKGKSADVQKAGDELHVGSVLTGRVTQRGDDLTIDMELDDVGNGKQLWGQQYHGKMADLLAMQNNIAKDVSARLGSQISAADQKNLSKGSTENAEAYQLYLKGKYSTAKFTKDGFDEASNYLNQAIAIDPNYGRAYSGLAFNYINQDDWYLPPNESAPAAKAAAEKALAIDDSDGLAHLSLALETEWYEWNQAAAGKQFERAVELSPDDSDVHGYYAWYWAVQGQMDRAAAEARRSAQANALSGQANSMVGIISLFARRWEASIEQLRNAKSIDPAYWFTSNFLGRGYEATGRSAEALAEFQHGLEVDKDNPELLSDIAHVYAVTGRKAEAEKIVVQLKELSERRWVAPYNTAIIYVGMGEKDQAFAWFERAVKDRSYYLEEYLSTDSRLDVLKDDPRFADLWKRIGLPLGH
jgi:TolB-like protein/Tfp pilus assembly protein PilF